MAMNSTQFVMEIHYDDERQTEAEVIAEVIQLMELNGLIKRPEERKVKLTHIPLEP